jgi:phosphoenolpyruvate carboxykinase (GTP)
VPTRTGLTLDGLKIAPEALDELFRVSADAWESDLADSREFFAKFGERLPSELRKEHEAVVSRFQKSVPA